MSTIYSFRPIAGNHAKILILGSMPGQASLAANQYYAHPRNAFWPIMAQLLQFNPDVSYAEKITALKSSQIALWDVLRSCHRIGSLDSSIEADTQTINDFQSFFSSHSNITHVFFNGGKAEACFKRYVLPEDNLGLLRFTRRLDQISHSKNKAPEKYLTAMHGMRFTYIVSVCCDYSIFN